MYLYFNFTVSQLYVCEYSDVSITDLSHLVALIKLIITINAAGIVDWLDSLVTDAEDDVHDHRR